MSTQSYHMAERDRRLEEVLADYLRAVEEGHPPSQEALLAQHPDLAEELQEFFRNREFIEQCTDRVRPVPAKIGDYQLLEVIGSGAFGVVFKARQVTLGNLVAIKLLRAEQKSSSEDVKRLVAKDGKSAKLKHNNIVSVYDAGEHEGQHYFVMELIEGGSLAQRLHGCTAEDRTTRRHQRWAAELMARVAQAMHHAHQALLIHRDLKPGNILLDSDGQPHITDFGLAKQIDEGEQLFELGPVERNAGPWKNGNWEAGPNADALTTKTGVIVGTAPYMSREQAAGEELTTASDLYSLGVILYEMLTGQVPIRGATPQETLRLIRLETVPPPRSLNRRIDYRLEKICLKCLEKDPQKRYGSALGLARNLERWLANVAIIEPPDGFAERCRLWCRRNPVLAGMVFMAAALLLLAIGMVVEVSRAARLAEEYRKGIAQGYANMMFGQFREWRREVYGVSEDLRPLLEQDDRPGLEKFLDQTLRRPHGPNFDDWIVLDGVGVLVVGAVPGHSTGHRDGKYDLRDYFLGAIRQVHQPHLDSVYVSRAYRSSFDGQYKIGVARALRNNRQPARPWVTVAFMKTDPTMGLPQLPDERFKVVLVGPEDPNIELVARNNSNAPITILLQNQPFAATTCSSYYLTASDRHPPFRSDPERYLIMLHPGYEKGVDPIPIPIATLGPLLTRPEANYFDRVAERLPQHYAGRWLAGSASVGDTEYSVIVEQSYDPDGGILRGAVAVLLGFLFLVALGWFGFQRVTRARD